MHMHCRVTVVLSLCVCVCVRRWCLSIGDNKSNQHHIKLGSRALEEVESFAYLGSEIGQSSKIDKEVNMRLKKASTKLKVFRTCVFGTSLASHCGTGEGIKNF